MQRSDLKRAGLLCINFNLRKAARTVTAIFDRNLASTGITSTQFSVLVALAYYPGHSINALAQFLAMDRTTLTKNLKPLLRDHLVETVVGGDRRQRRLRLSEKGKVLLEKAFPLWSDAQRQVSDVLGGKNEVYGLYRRLHKVSSLLQKSELALKN